MKVNNTSIFMGEGISPGGLREPSEANKTQRKTIDGSSLNGKYDPIAAKREEARKRAKKIVGDAFAKELKIDDDLNARRERIKSLQKELGDANSSIREIEENRAALRETYEVEEDSREEADLKLLEKEIRAEIPGSGVWLTGEDREAILKLKESGLTEYQQRSLEMLKSETPYAIAAYEAGEEIKMENRIISATELERLKSHAILDAEKQADAVMEEASKEIVSMIVEEAREHIEEENEEREEKAEAEKEKQEELEARIDAAQEKKKESAELTEDILKGSEELRLNEADVKAAQQEVKDMLSKMKLIEEDIKGAAVDQNL